MTYRWPVRVYYEDTDSGGVVYYANYLKFMERARTEWLRHYGIEQDRLREQDGVLFAVRRVAIEYHKPATFNDELFVSVDPADIGRASITFHQQVTRATGPDPEQDMMVLCSGEVCVACLNASSMKPQRIPDHVIVEIRLEH